MKYSSKYRMSKITMLELKLATVIRLYGKQLGPGAYDLTFPLAELAKTAESSIVLPSDRVLNRRRTKKNPFGFKPMVGLTVYDPKEEG